MSDLPESNAMPDTTVTCFLFTYHMLNNLKVRQKREELSESKLFETNRECC